MMTPTSHQRGTQDTPTSRIGLRIDVDASVPESIRTRFEGPLLRAFGRRGTGVYRIRVLMGRTRDEVTVVVKRRQHRTPLALFFPAASSLEGDDVSNTLSNVIEGMGPAFR